MSAEETDVAEASTSEEAKPTRNDAGEWECPECGETFGLALQLGSHRRQKHGVVGKSGRSSRRSRTAAGTGSARQESRKSKVKSALLDLANLADDLRGRTTSDLPEHLADVIRRDADQLATMIAALADRVNPVKFVVDRILQFAAPITASSGVLRWLLRAWRRQLEEREQAAPEFDETLVEVADWRTDVEAGREAAAADGG